MQHWFLRNYGKITEIKIEKTMFADVAEKLR
jgi:hypothetical protein